MILTMDKQPPSLKQTQHAFIENLDMGISWNAYYSYLSKDVYETI